MHAGLRYRPESLSTVVNYAFYISSSAPRDAIAALTTLLESNPAAVATAAPATLAKIHVMRGVLNAAHTDDKSAALVDFDAGAWDGCSPLSRPSMMTL